MTKNHENVSPDLAQLGPEHGPGLGDVIRVWGETFPSSLVKIEKTLSQIPHNNHTNKKVGIKVRKNGLPDSK